MKFIKKISKSYWELKILNWERFRSSRLSAHPWVKNIFQYIYNFIYLNPDVQNLLQYIKHVNLNSDIVQKGLFFMRQSFNRIWFKPPLYFLISSIICTFLAINLGGFFVFFFVLYCIFGSIFIYRNLAATWVRAYTKYGLNDFFEIFKMRRITRQKLLLNMMIRRKFILRKYQNKFYRKELFPKPYWNLCKTDFKDYTFNKNNIATIYKLFNKDWVLKHHISYYRINQSIDGRSKTLIEQNLLKNYILSKKTFLSQIEHKLRMQNTIVGDGKLLIKKVYAKYFVYDHKTNSKILLSCYALCWQTPDTICVPIVALGRWCIDSQEKKPWYVILERNVYHEAFLAGCPFDFYDVPQKKSIPFDFTPYKTAFAKDFKKWTHLYTEWFLDYIFEWLDMPYNYYLRFYCIYFDTTSWYKENIKKRGKIWRLRAIHRLFYPVRKRRIIRETKEFFKAIIRDPVIYAILIFLELLMLFVLEPFKFFCDSLAGFIQNRVDSMKRNRALSKTIVGETIYSPYIRERFDAYCELFEYYWIEYFPEYAWQERLLPGLKNLKKYPYVFLKETIRLIPIFIKEIYNQSKFVFSWISSQISSYYLWSKPNGRNLLVFTKSEKLKNQNKNNSQSAKALTQIEYFPTYLKYWRKHYIRLYDRVINSAYWQNYPTIQASTTYHDWHTIDFRLRQRYSKLIFLEYDYATLITLEGMPTLRHIYYEHDYQSWWEPGIIMDSEFDEEVRAILWYLMQAKRDSEVIISDVLTNEETLLIASLSRNDLSAVEIQDYVDQNLYFWVLGYLDILNAVPMISKKRLKKLYLEINGVHNPESIPEIQEYSNNYLLKTTTFSGENHMDIATFTSVKNDMELVRTNHKHNTNGIKTICRALKSNDLLGNVILSKFIIIELKSKSLILESIIKESCDHIYKIFTKNSNKTKIKISQKKTLKKKYLKFKLNMLNTYVTNYATNQLNTSLQYFINNEEKRIRSSMIPQSIYEMYDQFGAEKS